MFGHRYKGLKNTITIHRQRVLRILCRFQRRILRTVEFKITHVIQTLIPVNIILNRLTNTYGIYSKTCFIRINIQVYIILNYLLVTT